MESVRQQKVSRLLQKEIGNLLQHPFKHLSQGNMVSVTVVRVTPDLSYARVYVSVFPSKDPEKMVDNLNDHIHEISHSLYAIIRNQFRKMPEIKFYYDDSLDYADRIDELLND